MNIITTEEGLAVLLRSPCCDSQFVLDFGETKINRETMSFEIPFELKCPVCGFNYDVKVWFHKKIVEITTCNVCGEPLDFCECGVEESV